MLKVTPKDGFVRFEVHVKPRAKKSGIRGVRDGVLELSLAAPPVDGAANEELVRVLAKELGVPKSAIVIARGEGSRTKLVDVHGVSAESVCRRMPAD
jgi:uncharacterized protein (TIGR00251 family)